MDYRVTDFEGSTSDSILVFYKPPRCLKVMHPDEDRDLPYKPLLIPEALHLSNTDLILAGVNPPASPPVSKFGSEPAPDWCYYFEKAELASQIGDWETAWRSVPQPSRLVSNSTGRLLGARTFD